MAVFSKGNKTEIIVLLVIVGIILLVALFFVLFYFVFSKKRFKKQFKDLEGKYAYLNALLIGQNAQYIHRLEIISQTNLLYSEKYELFQKRFKDIFENDGKYADEMLKKINNLIANSQYKNIKVSMNEAKKAVAIFEDSVTKLNNDLYQIIKIEEDSRALILSLKEKYRKVKQTYLNKSNDFDIVANSFNSAFEKLELYFERFDQCIDSAEYDEANNLIPTIKKVIKALQITIDKLPNLCALVLTIIPDKISAISERYHDLERKNIPLYHLFFNKNLSKWDQELEQLRKKLINLDTMNVLERCERIENEIENMNNALTDEMEDRAYFETHSEEVYKEVLELEKSFVKICAMLPKIKEVYLIKESQEQMIESLREDINKLTASRRLLDGFIHSGTKQPYSLLRSKLEELSTDYEQAKTGVNNFQSFLSSLKLSCEEAYSMVYVYYYRTKSIEEMIREIAIDSLSEQYSDQINAIYEGLNDIDCAVQIKPIDVDSINEKVETLKTTANAIFDEIENKAREVQLAESAIVYLNRDRFHQNEVHKTLIVLEEDFFNGEFSEVYHSAYALFSKSHVEDN